MMNLTPAERLIVSLLCDLAKPEGKRELDAAFISKAVLYRHEWALDWSYDFSDGATESPPDVREVVDVLDMWDAIELAVSEMDGDQQQVVREGTGLGELPRFYGFDGNNESRFMSIAMFLVRDMGKWVRFKDRDFNSHMPSRGLYQRQLAVFTPIRDGLGHRATPYMSPEQVVSVVRERVHPENRDRTDDGSWTPKPRG